MPVNRNALIRYKTIDNCLRNRFRKWTLEDLIEACSEALYDYEGIDKGVSRRTIQMDIQMMRSDKLGYHAPIIVEEKKYYTYSDPEYSITNIPLTDQDLDKLSEVVDILKQFKGFTHFQDLSGMVQKLEDKIHVSKTNQRPIIDIEKNENLKGLEFIDPIFRAISSQKKLIITYQSFKARSSSLFEFHPALLKEWRNRWFVLGKKRPSDNFMMLALDRIEKLEVLEESVMDYSQYDLSNHFKDVIGATVNVGQEPQEVKILVYGKHVPYVLTKPMHHSQKVVEKTKEGVIISLRVQHNFELEKEILSFGEFMKVIAPARLRSKIKERLSHSVDIYQTDLMQSQIKHYPQKLNARGSTIINSVYTRKAIGKIGAILYKYKTNESGTTQSVYSIRNLLGKLPQLKDYLINANIRKILNNIDEKLFLTKAIYFDKPAESNWYVTWHQDSTINVDTKLELQGYQGWTKKEEFYGVRPPEEILKNTITLRVHLDDTNEENGALNIITGSHQKLLNKDEVQLITQNAWPSTCDVRTGGIHLMKPLLLHSTPKTVNQKNRRVIHLEFNSLELPNDIHWAERMEIN
ncbi:WYL domain-containing protein [Reichenbachiella ulvae]|uniref:WYL domain-containing protein n=1 Tax=Reichenbachiella ulvae TaxID=2980104 RepID=A0ABT3CQV1_9BACT|nr:WYL domain-containing protein [Reichenbachiella ulvae]MCV9386037.1 WYL domain-containing protein [Reichenbachiella ulvae]